MTLHARGQEVRCKQGQTGEAHQRDMVTRGVEEERLEAGHPPRLIHAKVRNQEKREEQIVRVDRQLRLQPSEARAH